MALDKPAGGGSNRRPSFHNVLYQCTWRGTEVARKWPKGRGKSIAAKTRDQMEFFRQVQWAFKFTDHRIIQQYAEAVAGTPLLPRDLYLSAMAGRMLAFYTPEGRLVVSVPANNDVSQTLDFLGSEVGSILLRTEEGWLGLSPGAVGDVLTMAGDPALPLWAEGGGGGGGASTLLPPPSSGQLRFNIGANVPANISLQLTYAWAEVPMVINRIKVPILGTPSGTYRAVIYDWAAIGALPPSTATAPIVAEGPPTVLVNGPSVQNVPFAAPVSLPAGRIYLIGLHKTGAAIQTSMAALNFNRQGFTTTIVLATPPANLPALTIAPNTNNGWWTE
jgi:hypothetical protein